MGERVDREIAAALAGSAAASAAVPTPDDGLHTAAGLAWRWVVSTDALDLYADPAATDDQWRETLIGGGGALHRARVALAAEGLAARVSLLPDANPDHLARLVTVGSIEITPEAVALYDATDTTGNWRDRGRAPSRGFIRDLTAAARAEGVRLRIEEEEADTLIAVLHGPDTREAWLRAGAALSAIRLMASRRGLAAMLSLASDEPRPGRRRVGEREGWLTVGIGTPYVRLRITSRGADEL
jgi:hypothetical protein